MSGVDEQKNERLAGEIRRQFASPSSRRYLETLSPFRPADDGCDLFDDLLDQLDRAEKGRRNS